MKKLNITVNGTTYEVVVEEVTGDAAQAPAAPAPATAPAGGETIKAPMPGNILAVNVAAGDTVKEGDVLMILEAMKMENEIMAPVSGKVLSVNTSKGATVESGSILCVIG